MTDRAAVAKALRFAMRHSTEEYVTVEPERGLYLQLCQVDGVLRLTLRRADVYPTLAEAQSWADAFGVPDGTDNMEQRSWASRHPITQRKLRWCTVKFTWRELAEA